MERTQTNSAAKPSDALTLLMDDHKKVKKLFKTFEGLKESGGDEEKAALVEQICQELNVHMQIEEELFYPAARDALPEEDADVLDEADVEHSGAKELVAQLEGMEPGDDHYDAKVTVLGEYIEHHVKEEEGTLFPKLKKAKLDVGKLGAALARRKQELLASAGMPKSPPPRGAKPGASHAHK